jgi:hypothetical protein
MGEYDRALGAIVAVFLNDAQFDNTHAHRARPIRSSYSHRVLTTPIEFAMLSIKNSSIQMEPVEP